MPTASDADRARMERWFGDPIGDQGPITFLRSRGYVLTRDWFWIKPVSAHTISHEECVCMLFLIDEWDFGGIVGEWT